MTQPVEEPESGNRPSEDEQGPVLKGEGPFTPHPDVEEDAEADAAGNPRSKQKRTNLHIIINKRWGRGELDDYIYEELIKYASPDTAKETKNGFELELLNGRKIRWEVVQEEGYPQYEQITGSRRGFNMEEAAAMAALAALRGWAEVNVFGTIREKEMLWLAAQLQNLQVREKFETAQAAGEYPLTDENGNPAPIPQMVVNGFTPLMDSEIVARYRKAEAEYLARRPVPPQETAPETEPVPEAEPEAEPKAKEDGLKEKFKAEADPPQAPAPEAAPETPAPEETKNPSTKNKNKHRHGRHRGAPHRHHKR